MANLLLYTVIILYSMEITYEMQIRTGFVVAIMNAIAV